MNPQHLFAGNGRFVAWYHPGLPYLWSVHDRWIGWFAWPDDPVLRGDAVDTTGTYLGTVVGDRLLSRVYREPVPLPARVAEPKRPVGPPDRANTLSITPPPGFVEVPATRLR